MALSSPLYRLGSEAAIAFVDSFRHFGEEHTQERIVGVGTHVVLVIGVYLGNEGVSPYLVFAGLVRGEVKLKIVGLNGNGVQPQP